MIFLYHKWTGYKRMKSGAEIVVKKADGKRNQPVNEIGPESGPECLIFVHAIH
jgi:hypothetical protein